MQSGLRETISTGVARPGAGGGLHVAEADGAHLAVVLRDDDVGRERLQRLAVDAVDGQAVAHDLLHAGVDLGAGALHLEFRRGQLRAGAATSAGKSHSWLRPTSRSRAPERADDLGGAGDQADDALW